MGGEFTEKQDMIQIANVIDALYQSINSDGFDNNKLQSIYNGIEQTYKLPQEPYSILSGPEIFYAFVLNNWTFREDLDSNLKNLKALSASIRSKFTSPIGVQIDKDQLIAMFNLADSKYSIASKLLTDSHIDILLAENSCTEENALYYYNPDPRCKIKDMILMTYSRDTNIHPSFSFLHELGHMVHTRVTQQSFIAPKSFDAMHSIINRYTKIPLSKTPKKAEKRWLAEWFAECFAIAVLHNSPYTSLDYHTEINDSDKDEIQMYMDVFMSTLRHNKNGKRTWDQLKEYYSKI